MVSLVVRVRVSGFSLRVRLLFRSGVISSHIFLSGILDYPLVAAREGVCAGLLVLLLDIIACVPSAYAYLYLYSAAASADLGVSSNDGTSRGLAVGSRRVPAHHIGAAAVDINPPFCFIIGYSTSELFRRHFIIILYWPYFSFSHHRAI